MSSSKMTDIEGGLIKLNNLQYTVPESLSVVISKQFKYFPADKTSYQPKNTIFATLSTGQQYVDLNESYFSFDVDIKNFYPGTWVNRHSTGGGAIYPEFQHIMQLFRHIRITHFSGTVVWEDQYFASHWLQDRALEVPQEKLKQEIEQGRGTTHDAKLATDIRFNRKPGAYKSRDYDTNQVNTFDLDSGNRMGMCGGLVDELEKKQRNLGFYKISGRNAPSNGVDNGQWLGTAGEPLQSELLFSSYIKGKYFINSPILEPTDDYLSGTTIDENAKFDQKLTFHIPFHWIPFFRHEQNSLMPSMLANGMKVEFVLNDVWDWLCQPAPFAEGAGRNQHICSRVTYEISNFRTNLQLVDLTARIYALLLQESINTGLYWVTDATYTTMAQSVPSSFMIECTRALSRCKMVKAIPFIQNAHQTRATIGTLLPTAAQNGDPTTHFSYASADVGFSRWRFVLGSMSYPAQDCEERERDNTYNGQVHTDRHETYTQLLHAYGYNDQRSDDGVLPTYYDFLHSGIYQACISLERSPTMQQTGLSLSTDASLRFIGTLGKGNEGAVVDDSSKVAIYVFVTYSTTCQIIGDKVIVKN
jgi:hypothetical protein